VTAGWAEYQARVRRLGQVCREVAAADEERAVAVRAAGDQLAGVRHRLVLQQARLVDVATRARQPVPPLAPAPAEVASALATMTAVPAIPPQGGDHSAGPFAVPRSVAPAMISTALRAALASVDAADGVLTGADPGWAPRSPGLRNSAVYGGYALLLALLQIPALLAVFRQQPAGVFTLCGLVLPVVAFALGWVTVGLVFHPPDGMPVRRTPLVGAAVSLLAAAPVLGLLAAAIVSAVT
jgi:hypothetical protein